MSADMPRTEQLDADRAEAWDELRFIAAWGGDGTPRHEEGRRIIRAAHHHARECRSGCRARFDDVLDVIDPTGNSFPVAVVAAWDARKANA